MLTLIEEERVDEDNRIVAAVSNYDGPMTLFKRLPRLGWKASEAQEIIPPDVPTQCPELGTDFKLLAEELMPHFRELDANAQQLQNEFRLEQVLLIFSGALVTILGALHASLGAVWIGITESVLAAALSAVAMRAKTTRVQQGYFTDRLKAEKHRTKPTLNTSPGSPRVPR